MRPPWLRSLLRAFTSGRGRWWTPSVLYLLAVLVVYAGGVAVGSFTYGEPTLASIAYEPLLFPLLFLYVPPSIAVVFAFRGYPPIASIALGLSVGLAFAALAVLAALLGTSGNGDSPFWALSLFFAGTGLVTVTVGHALGLVGRLTVDRFAERTGFIPPLD